MQKNDSLKSMHHDNLSPHVLASGWSHQNCCSRCSPAHVERERCGGPKVAQMHPGNIPQRPGSVPATSRQQRPGSVPAASQQRPGSSVPHTNKQHPDTDKQHPDTDKQHPHTVPATTCRSQRAPKCHYNDLVPDNLPVPASAQLALQRSRASERSGVITTIWSQPLPRCYYDDLVPASAQMSLRRSGPSDRPSVIATIGSQRLPRRKYALWGSAFQDSYIFFIRLVQGFGLDVR